MKNDQLPEGFLATREGATVRVHLPEVVVTDAHVLLPMLTRGSAQRLAEALWEADVDAPLERVVLVRDARIPEQDVAKFGERLLALFIEGGMDAQVETEVEPGTGEPAPGEPPTAASAAEPAPAPPPRPPPPTAATEGELSPPAPPGPPGTPAEPPLPPIKKQFVAPVPTRRRVGGPRTPEGGNEG